MRNLYEYVAAELKKEYSGDKKVINKEELIAFAREVLNLPIQNPVTNNEANIQPQTTLKAKL